MSANRLARAYRRRLWAYPRDYRRDRADEIVATHIDAAPPDRVRPTLRETANLARHGLRARLGRPASRSVVVWALVAALGTGLYAAAFGAWLGWQTTEPVSPIRAVAALPVPGHATGTPPAIFTIYSQPLSWNNARTLLSPDGGEYRISTTSVTLAPPSDGDTAAEANRLRDRLRGDGWTVSPANTAADTGWTTLRASRGDLRLDVTYAPADAWAELSPATPAAAWALAVAAGIVGAAGGYVAFGWAGRRTDGRRVRAAVAETGFALAVFFGWAPILIGVPLMAAHHNENAQDTPLWEWFGLPTLSILALGGLASAIVALTSAALPRRGVAERVPAE
jgi:hypothetical protein